MVSTDASAQALAKSGEAGRTLVYTSNVFHRCSVLKERLKTSNRSFEERCLENADALAELVMWSKVVLSAQVRKCGGFTVSWNFNNLMHPHRGKGWTDSESFCNLN